MSLLIEVRDSSEALGLSWNENIIAFGPGYVCSRVGNRHNRSFGDE